MFFAMYQKREEWEHFLWTEISHRHYIVFDETLDSTLKRIYSHTHWNRDGLNFDDFLAQAKLGNLDPYLPLFPADGHVLTWGECSPGEHEIGTRWTTFNEDQRKRRKKWMAFVLELLHVHKHRD